MKSIEKLLLDSLRNALVYSFAVLAAEKRPQSLDRYRVWSSQRLPLKRVHDKFLA